VKEVEITYTRAGGWVKVLVEESVPRHSQLIDPPFWSEHGFSTMEEARAWVEDEEKLWVIVKETETTEEKG